MSLSKMEQAKVLEKEIKEIEKKLTLMQNIQKGFAEAGISSAPVCVKVNPQYNNFIPLEEQYMPIGSLSFIEAYIGKINDHRSSKQMDLDQIFN